MKKLLLFMVLLLCPRLTLAQAYQPPTPFTAPGTLALPTGLFSYATVLIQATGNGSGLTFSAQCLPVQSTTWITVPMVAVVAGVSSAPAASASANGAYWVSSPGCSSLRVNLTAIGGGTESFAMSGATAPSVTSVTTAQSPTSPALTPIAPPGGNLTLTTGGASQQLLSTMGCPNFITVSNGQTAADQGGIVAAETAYYNPTGNAASATPGGQSIPIYPGVKTSIVAQAGKAITWVAATTGHQLTAVCE